MKKFFLFLLASIYLATSPLSVSSCFLANAVESNFSYAPLFIISGPDDGIENYDAWESTLSNYVQVYTFNGGGCVWSGLFLNKWLVYLFGALLVGSVTLLIQAYKRRRVIQK